MVGRRCYCFAEEIFDFVDRRHRCFMEGYPIYIGTASTLYFRRITVITMINGMKKKK